MLTPVEVYLAGWAATTCPTCSTPVYYRLSAGAKDAALRAHMSWAHPVYRTRLQSIQETGRRPGGRRKWWQW